MNALAFIILLTSALSHKVTAQTETLDGALNAVDDLYTECREDMLQMVTSGSLLSTELNATLEFNKAWNAVSSCTKLIPGGTKLHTEALAAFGHYKKLRKHFNEAVLTLGANASVYNSDFRFKSLHFLLMDSLNLLKTKECKTMYGRSEQTHKAVVGATVRFGQFIMAELVLADAAEEAVTIFNITACSSAYVSDYMCSPENFGTWMISPAEMFTVESIKTMDYDGHEYTEIKLGSLNMNTSYHDCYGFTRTTPTPTRMPTTGPTPPAPTTRSSSDTKWPGSSMFGLMALCLSASLSIVGLTNSE